MLQNVLNKVPLLHIFRFNEYPTQFSFGPVIARLLYHLKKPEVAYKFYTDPVSDSAFYAFLS